MDGSKKCDGKTEVWSRCTGFFRPISSWNKGKRQEYNDRVEYSVEKALKFTPADDTI